MKRFFLARSVFDTAVLFSLTQSIIFNAFSAFRGLVLPPVGRLLCAEKIGAGVLTVGKIRNFLDGNSFSGYTCYVRKRSVRKNKEIKKKYEYCYYCGSGHDGLCAGVSGKGKRT